MSTAVKRGQWFQSRRHGTVRELIGFTTKPDGIRRARLRDPLTENETKVKAEQILKSYQPLDA